MIYSTSNRTIQNYVPEINQYYQNNASEKNERMNMLVENNQRLVYRIAAQYGKEEDLAQIGFIGLIKAANTFEFDKGAKFATYAGRCIKNEILMALRKEKRSSRAEIVYFDDVVSVDRNGNRLTLGDTLGREDKQLLNCESEKVNQLLLETIMSLPQREKFIICHLYGLGCTKETQDEVAKQVGLSQAHVSRLEKNILKKLRMKMKI